MNDYPHWIDFVSFLGLDPITVWYEYRYFFLSAVGLTVVSILVGLYYLALALRDYLQQAKYTFTDKYAFYRKMDDLDWEQAAAAEKALGSKKLVFAVPAIAAEDVTGFRHSLGLLILTERTLIFAGMKADAGRHAEFAIDSILDANIKDGVKHVMLKLFLDDRKPTFQMLGVSREHGQEIFMKMHAFRLALKEEANPKSLPQDEQKPVESEPASDGSPQVHPED